MICRKQIMDLFVKKILLGLIFGLIITSSVSGQSPRNAVVKKVRGRVIASLPNGKKIQIKTGDKIPPKSKLTSKSKSFAIITFPDKTKLTLGPNSKMEIKSPSTPNAPGLINLLKGQLRSKVKPNKKRKGNKLVISSRAAAIGVRGTETVITYNPSSNRLTTGGMTGLVLISPPLAQVTIEAARKALSDNNPKTYKLPAAHFSSVSMVGGRVKISAPRKLNPVQLNILRKNPEPNFNAVSLTKGKSEHKRSASLPNLSVSAQQGLVTDISSEQKVAKAGNAQMPAGSFIDLKTGALIPPPPGSEYDANSGTFIVDSKYGTVSTDGQYLPPPGLELDESGKFVATDDQTPDVVIQESSTAENTTTQAVSTAANLAAEMNNIAQTALNSEAIYINPNTEAINKASNDTENKDNKDRATASNNQGEKTGDVDQIPPQEALSDVIADASDDYASDSTDAVNTDSSCPGNICDRFDTVAPTSDQASNKTLVQFRIRINNK